MKKYFTAEELNDVMNLGMMLRQDQLRGYSDGRSGNEVLAEYTETHGKTLEEINNDKA